MLREPADARALPLGHRSTPVLGPIGATVLVGAHEAAGRKLRPPDRRWWLDRFMFEEIRALAGEISRPFENRWIELLRLGGPALLVIVLVSER